MLRVTIKKEDLAEVWELEGRLSGEWVSELERCWAERPASTGAALQVHLKAVSFVDAAGKHLLAEMHGRGVEIKGGGCVTRAVAEEIVGHSGGSKPRAGEVSDRVRGPKQHQRLRSDSDLCR